MPEDIQALYRETNGSGAIVREDKGIRLIDISSRRLCAQRIDPRRKVKKDINCCHVRITIDVGKHQ